MSFFRSFIKSLYVCVFVGDGECSVYGEICKNKQKIANIEADFEILETGIDIKFNEYYKKNAKKVHSAYLALLLNTKKQWALPVSDRTGYNKFGVNYNEVHVVEMPGNWSIFIAKEEIKKQISFLNNAHLDLLYSPYALLYDKICEFMADDKITLYVYAQKSSFAILIFKGSAMLFASFFNNEVEQKAVEDDNLAPINIADIDNIIAKEDDKFNALNTLNALSEVGNEISSDNFEDMTKIEDIERSGAQIEEGLERVGRCGVLLNNIKEAMNDYYKNTQYESDFIEKIVVFDSESVIDEQNFVEIVTHEIFIEATVFNVDKHKDLLNIIKRDLG